jgi:hypothetical protein
MTTMSKTLNMGMSEAGTTCAMLLGALLFATLWMDHWPVAYTLILSVGAALLYFVYYLVSTGAHLTMIRGLIFSVIVLSICAITPVGWIIIIGFILYNISKSVDGIKSLLPEAIYSVILLGSLYGMSKDSHLGNGIQTAAIAIYAITALNYCRKISKLGLNTKDALFRLASMWLSIPLLLLLVASIFSSIRNMFNFSTLTTSNVIKTPQQVSAHTRVIAGQAVDVAEYTRHISTTVTQVQTQILPGSGAISAQLGRDMFESTGSGIPHSPTSNVSSNSEPGQLVPHCNHQTASVQDTQPFNPGTLATLKNDNFHVYPDIDPQKISNLMDFARSQGFAIHFDASDVRYLYDNTLFGKSDRGALISSHHLIVALGKLGDNFQLELARIAALEISGLLNKTIHIQTHDHQHYRIEFSQSNKGAQCFFEALRHCIDL